MGVESRDLEGESSCSYVGILGLERHSHVTICRGKAYLTSVRHIFFPSRISTPLQPFKGSDIRACEQLFTAIFETGRHQFSSVIFFPSQVVRFN